MDGDAPDASESADEKVLVGCKVRASAVPYGPKATAPAGHLECDQIKERRDMLSQ